MNEIISRSYDFKRWLRCQIAVQLQSNVYLYDDGRLVGLSELVQDYLKDTNSTNQWKKIHANLRGVGV